MTVAHPLGALFDPASVAVFGATDRVGAVGYYVLRNLLQQSFAGDVLPINLKHDKAAGDVAGQAVKFEKLSPPPSDAGAPEATVKAGEEAATTDETMPASA